MKPPSNKLEALQAASQTLAAGKPVPEPVASWLADGLRWYLEHEGASLDEALLLKPAPGKPALWQQARYQERRGDLRKLAEAVDGICWRSAETIAGWLQEMAASDGQVPAGLTTSQLQYLVPVYLADAPRTPRRVWEIIRRVY